MKLDRTIIAAACMALAVVARGGDWPQFHGPRGSGIRANDDGGPPLPEKIGPKDSVVWRVALPPGHSSPVVVGDRIFLTAADGEKLLTIALSTKDGSTLWSDEAPHEKMEEIHPKGSYAQPSAAADSEVVATFFGSSGLSVYMPDGKCLWRKRMGPFNDNYGAGSSPILCGDRVIINQDHDTGSFLMALDKKTGEVAWQADRAEFPRGYSTPVIWDAPAGRQIVVAGTIRIVGYDFATGKEMWTVRGLARIANSTPVIGPDNSLYLAIWAPGGDAGGSDRISPVAWSEALARDDKNSDGVFQSSEPSDLQIRQRFAQIDRDKDGKIDENEYTSMRKIFEDSSNVAMRIKPGCAGEATETHVAWRQEKNIPYVPSSIVYRGLMFMARNGGVVSTLDAETGKIAKQARVAARGDYFASPVAGDGKVYLLSEAGELTVLSAEAEWKELYQAAFEESAFATPAIVDGRIYVRTAAALYCFGN